MPKSRAKLVCGGCGFEAAADALLTFRCPRAKEGDDIDHIIEVSLLGDCAGLGRDGIDRVDHIDSGVDADCEADDPNPFVRYRARSFAYAKAREFGMRDADFVQLVRDLDTAVEASCGTGFRVTEWDTDAAFEEETSHPFGYKDETVGVAGSHKARHLFGLVILIEVAERVGLISPGKLGSPESPLAIASCGNAALAAAVLAHAWKRSLRVFIPADADPAVVSELERLGAQIVTCPRTPDLPPGDPCVLAFRAAVASGAVPFTCQGPENGLVIDGGKTLGYELAEAFEEGGTPDRLFIQVGGGALASATCQALEETLGLEGMPMIHAVQTTSCHPLATAFEALLREIGDDSPSPDFFHEARQHRSRYMRPVTTPVVSIATGILDDETYDWFRVARAMLLTGGSPITVTEAQLEDAREHAAPDADATGAAGLAGFLALLDQDELELGESAGVLFTGIDRNPEKP